MEFLRKTWILAVIAFIEFPEEINCIPSGFVTPKPRVSLRQGELVGHHKTSYRGRTFSAFEGIPYAVPPVGNLRFKEPVPAGPWNGTLHANKYYACPTFKFTEPFTPLGVEDCLYLYVYVPKLTIHKKDNFSVLAYVHGGGFWFGSPGEVATPDYLMDQNIILVTFNYRLGVLGYLSTEDEVVPGNNGMKDQSLALRWIKENIAQFGGNPDSVTLFGISSGGASVHLHYLSPWSKGLFHRGFSSSGTALSSFAEIPKPLEKTKKLASTLNCPTTSSDLIVDCLRFIPVEELLQATINLYAQTKPYAEPGVLFGPAIEKNPDGFLPGRPIDLITSNQHLYDVPWITSITHDDGASIVQNVMANKHFDQLSETWDSIATYILDLEDRVDDSELVNTLEKIKKFYFGNDGINNENIEQLIKVSSDREFFIPAEHSIRIQSAINKSPTYLFEFSFLPEHYIYNEGLRAGVVHATDEQLYFKLNRVPNKLAKHEEDEMIIFTKFLADYVINGTPKVENTIFPPIDPLSKNLKYVEVVSAGDIRSHNRPHISNRIEFWDSLPIKNLKIPVSSAFGATINKTGYLSPTKLLEAYYNN